MRVVKYKGKILGANLSASEQKAMELEINKQIAKADRENRKNIDATILWCLHQHLGFGVKRLHDFYIAFGREYEKLVNHYELEDGDGVWLCMQKLKELGIDLDIWAKEALVDYDGESETSHFE